MNEQNGELQASIPISGMYENWFLDYASYVILDRAVPTVEDGLKPVQRRLLHALKIMDDGRFHKVANAIGQTMQYHPHGDASIYEALVNLGQKDLLIETQGNWGDFRTGDKAAASRYIEARLSKFALDVAFNKDITEWQLSYDGRKKEPVNLPLKFPLLLAQGVEGIAVGLATKVLPHNFIELLKASIQVLKGRKTNILPDFPTGGMADFSNYNEGKKGGRVRARANIEAVDKKTLKITDLPYGVTTDNLINSILKANEKGKIKIKKVTDNTAKNVEIEVELASGVSPDMTIDALYAFSNCEVSIAPNCCVIVNNKPQFMGVNELLKLSTQHTVELLRMELEVKLNDLLEKLHFASLEQIFIEKRIYRRIEECETFEAVIEEIDTGLKPYIKQFVRPVTRDDIIRLTEIKIKRISKYDSFKARDLISKLNESIAEVRRNLANIVDYAIEHFEYLLKKYGKGRERKTEIRNFDTIEVAQVAVKNEKLYINRAEGFIGYGLKKDEYICDCSAIDDIIVFRKDGKYSVNKIGEKVFVGKNIIYADVWKKGDERKIYHCIYYDGKSKRNYVKRFAVTAITREREYDMTKGNSGSKLIYFSAHPNSEAEVVNVSLSPNVRAKKKVFDYDFSELDIKGRASKGNILSPYPIRKVVQKELGASTLGGRKIWLDEAVGRLNTAERGRFLGKFDTGDNILVIHEDGSYELTDFELTNRYDLPKIASIDKFEPQSIVSAIYYHKKRKCYYVKRFKIETSTLSQKYPFIDEENGKLEFVSLAPMVEIEYEYKILRGGTKYTERVNLSEFIDVKGWKALGNILTKYKIGKITDLSPEIVPAETKAKETSTTKQPKPDDKATPKVDDDGQGSLF